MKLFPLLLALFVAVPVIEIYLFITVGGWLGALPTIAIVIVTAVVGVSLLRSQGLQTIQRAQAVMSRGQAPAMEMMEGLVLVFLAALLLTPGFFTDAIGFLGLVPAFRRAMILSFVSRGAGGVRFGGTGIGAEKAGSKDQGSAQTTSGQPPTDVPSEFAKPGAPVATPRNAQTLEGEYRREE